MNLAAMIPLADSWGIHIGSGWVIAMVVMMVLCMGAMMFGMAWMGGRSGRSARRWSMPWERFMARESPVETLERRFAAGEISVEDYRARREVLVNGNAKPNGDHEDKPLTAPRAGEGRQ